MEENIRVIQYLGSKLKLLDEIKEEIDRVTVNKGIVVDLFAGTGVVASCLARDYKVISFFFTNTKAITNVCKNLEKYAMQETMPHQYIEVLRKMGLVNKNEQITKYGQMLLKIIYHDNNRIIDEFNQPNVSVENISEDIPFIIEFFLFAVHD